MEDRNNNTGKISGGGLRLHLKNFSDASALEEEKEEEEEEGKTTVDTHQILEFLTS